MAIFLTILKIIGIVLLVILGVLLTVLGLVLFVPIRYRVDGEFDKNREIPADVNVKITWLLHLINATATYTDKLFYRARICVITLISSEPKKKKDKKPRKQKSNKKEENVEYSIDWNEDKKEEQPQIEEKTSEIIEEDKAPLLEDKGIEEEQDEPKKSLFEKIKEFVCAVKDFILKLKNGVDLSINKVQKVYDNIDYYIEAINDEKNKKAFEICIVQLKNIFKNIKPKKFICNIDYGSDDPGEVGKILAISGIIYPIFENHVVISGYFDDDLLKVDLHIKGRITLFVIIKAAWILYFNKDIKRMLRIFKRED